MDALIVIATFLLITGGVIWAVRATAKPAEKKVEKPKEEYISPSDRAYMREHNLLNNAPPKKRTFVKREETPTPAPTVVVHDSGPDLLTTMILMDAMSSKHDTTSGSVTWKDEIPTTIHRSNTSNPIDFPTTPSYTSSYSSSSDDSSSRSSYSSSSSSDSSYSSSSSDSSYSSSSD